MKFFKSNHSFFLTYPRLFLTAWFAAPVGLACLTAYLDEKRKQKFEEACRKKGVETERFSKRLDVNWMLWGQPYEDVRVKNKEPSNSSSHNQLK